MQTPKTNIFINLFYDILIITLACFVISGCSSSKHLEENEYLLNKVKLTTNDKHLKTGPYRLYIRQEANARWFNLVKVPLGFYNIAGKDSTKHINKFFKRIGEAPIVYNNDLTVFSRNALTSALQSRGYLHAKVEVDTTITKRKINVNYQLIPGNISYLKNISYKFDNPTIRDIVLKDTTSSMLYKGAPLSVSLLQSERNRIIDALRNLGYYKINKEYISYQADTTSFDDGVDLTLHFRRPAKVDSLKDYQPFTLRKVTIYEDVDYTEKATDSVYYHNLNFEYNNKIKLSKRMYCSHVHIHQDSLFHENSIDNTYSSLNGLSSINYSTIHFSECDSTLPLLDCDVRVKTNKFHSLSTELEGTNTSGDLGAALAFTYNNKNLFHCSENFSIKLRGAYEAITGLEGYKNENYIGYSAETKLRFPTFIFPGITSHARQYMKASSELSFMYDSQNRPEFHRRVVTGNWGYRWNKNHSPKWHHRFDLFSINYVFMPWISDTFREEYLEGDDPRYAMLRSSYENILIMKLGYGFTYNSIRTAQSSGLLQTNGYQIRFNVETAGNLLQGISKLTKASQNSLGQYQVFNIAYSQYAKFDFDYAKSFLINERNSIALHTALGIAIPYGNSDIIPYEKRYFSGGANSVRGWSVRELGPGSYVCKDGKIDFINQTGNLKFDFSVEYRTQLYSKFHGAFFIDAGNVWNTRNYADQPGGQFKINKFYKQIALAYGLGLRLNLDYFILRLDGGMKAINPTIESGKGHFPIINPNFKRDFTLHFAVGLPF